MDRRFAMILGSVCILFLAAILTPLSTARADGITYYLTDYPYDENGWSLSGFIVTDGTTGQIGIQDIGAWQWTLTNGDTSYTVGSTHLNRFNQTQINLYATAQALSIPDVGDALAGNSVKNPTEYVSWSHPSYPSENGIEPQYFPPGSAGYAGSGYLWNAFTSEIWENNWQIAAVPEPSTWAA